MGRVKTYSAGSSCPPSDLNALQDDWEGAFSSYKASAAVERTNVFGAATAAGTFVLLGPQASGSGALPTAALGSAFYFDPADWAAAARTTKLRVRGLVITNAVAPATNWTVGLYPVATWGGAAGAQPTVATLGAVIAGSTVLFTTPGAAGPAQGNSGDFTAPVAGHYVLAVVNSGVTAANSLVVSRAELQVRQV